MSLFGIVLLNLLVVSVIMFLLWLVSLRINDVSIVDIFWGAGFVIIAVVTFLSAAPVSPRSVLLVVLVTAWGLRLAVYLAWRKAGEGEDRRYRAMRDRHGKGFQFSSLFVVFGLQAVIMWIVSIPIQVGQFGLGKLGWLDACGVAIWACGWLCESIGDWQLARFKSDPRNKGRVLDTGLWRYTRHPNYFGDFLVWWGLYLIAAAAGAWWTIFSPLIMSVLLMRVSGVTLLERSMEDRPGYREYVARTNAFFPGWR